MQTDPRIDAYIAKAPEFARPILERIRAAFHAGGPGLAEDIKWGMPYFVGKGLVGGMAAFKRHVSLGFWRGRELADPEGLFQGVGESEMCALKVASLAELPAKKVLVAYVQQAVALDAAGAESKKKAAPRTAPKAPADLLAALKAKKKALATFEAFPPSHKREYVEWITEAKRSETRAKRIAQAVEWMAEGKSRNWRYMKR